MLDNIECRCIDAKYSIYRTKIIDVSGIDKVSLIPRADTDTLAGEGGFQDRFQFAAVAVLQAAGTAKDCP